MKQKIRYFTDQLGRSVSLSGKPFRIVSTVPSQTELLIDLCGVERIVGRTKFCLHPYDKISTIPKIGGTKNLRLQTIQTLEPDLIVANKEENDKEQIEQLAQLFPTWVSDIPTVDASLQMIESLGILVGEEDKALKLLQDIQGKILQLKSVPKAAHIPVLYLIWQNPFMTIGGDTFISDMLRLGGFQNVYADSKRYPIIEKVDLMQLPVEFIFLSSEPYPFNATHQAAIQAAFPKQKVILVDGELFSWYGSRLLKGIPYLKELF